jgi:hypothetical protein
MHWLTTLPDEAMIQPPGNFARWLKLAETMITNKGAGFAVENFCNPYPACI